MAKKEIEQVSFPSEYKVLGCDFGLKRPGFCLLTMKDSEIKEIYLTSVDNKTDRKKPHGELLDDVLKAFLTILPENGTTYLVRENEIMKMKVPSERSLSKVVGLVDWVAWQKKLEWYSLYPTTIKKLITGSGKADKSEVADALTKYIGQQNYKCDDESDAAAVAIAWLIQQGQIKEKTDG